MSIKVALTHRTTYRYDRHVSLSPQVIRLRPAPHSRTSIVSYSLTLEPKDHFVNWQQDPFGNFLARMVANEQTDVLSVTVDLVAEMAVLNPFNFFVEESAREWPFAYDDALKEDLQPYLAAAPPGSLLQDYLATLKFGKDAATLDVVVELNRNLEQHIDYLIRMEPGVQAPEQTLAKKSGIVPRHQLASGSNPTQPGSRSTVCVRLPDTA